MRILIMTANGFEDTELLCPYYRFREEGFQVDICAPEWGEITGKHGYTVSANLSLSEVSEEAFVLLYLPGGKAPGELRLLPEALEIVRAFHQAQKPIAAICHGPQVLVSAGILKSKKATCYPKIAKELEALGVIYIDDEVVVDGNIITSRRPADLPAFMKAILNFLKKRN